MTTLKEKLSKYTLDELTEMYYKAGSIKTLAKEFGCYPETLSLAFRELGLNVNQLKQKGFEIGRLTSPLKGKKYEGEALQHMKEANAKRLATYVSLGERVIQEYGIEGIKKRYFEFGGDVYKVAKSFGCGYNTLSDALKKHNIKFKDFYLEGLKLGLIKPPAKGIKWKDESRKKLSETIKSQIESGERDTTYLVEKMRQAWTGSKHTEESKKKISKALMGENNPAWNRIKKACLNCENEFETSLGSTKKFCSMKCVREYIKKYRIKKKCLNCGKEFYAFPSNIKIGNDKFCSKRCALTYQKYNQKQSNTSIELKMKEALEKRGIPFEQQKEIRDGRFCVYPDFYIELNHKKILVFCDGDFFHGNPEIFKDEKLPHWVIEQRKRDKKITYKLTHLGYRVLRFYENEIENNADECINKIIQST
jgi:DNA mismatch endonuclease (patch repair protein)